jgi:hypothetical protein
MLRVNLLTSPLFIVGALLVVRDYGPIGVASMTAAITVLQNMALVLVAKRKTGIWTHVSLSPSRLRKVPSKRVPPTGTGSSGAEREREHTGVMR